MDHILSDLSTMTHPSWVAPQAWLSIIKLDKCTGCNGPRRSVAKRSYPTSEVRGGGQEEIPHAPKPQARGGGREEIPHAAG